MNSTGITVYGCGRDEAALFRAMAPRLGAVPTITADAATESTAGLARGNRCVSVSHRARVTHGALRALRRAGVEYVSTRSIGYDHIDVDYAKGIGLAVGNVAYAPDGVADHTLMLMLMALRQAKAVIRRADAHDYRLSETRGRELRDLTVGVIGTGRIGTAVIDRLRGFGSRVLAHDTRARPSAGHVPLDELLGGSDIVTLHAPLTADTHHLLDRRRIERMRPGAFIVNTARGALLETGALLSALESGRLGGAALDVLEGEEGVFYADRAGERLDETLVRLQALPNVLITPHTAYYTDRALAETVESTIRNCLNHLNHESERQHA